MATPTCFMQDRKESYEPPCGPAIHKDGCRAYCTECYAEYLEDMGVCAHEEQALRAAEDGREALLELAVDEVEDGSHTLFT